MKIPFFDYPQLWLNEREELLEIIDNTSSNGSFIMQSELDTFEKNLSEYTGSKFSMAWAMPLMLWKSIFKQLA